jgi:hypothetical protein
MADRSPAQYARILICCALYLLPHATQAQTESVYKVELLVFSYPLGGTAEQWDATPDLAYPKLKHFLTLPGDPTATALTAGPATLPSTQREFAGRADSMQRSGRYRILFHEAWIQPMVEQSAALPIVLDRSGDGGQWPALQGSIKLYTMNDLYLETNLWLNTQGEYLHSTWRMPPPPLGPRFVESSSAISEQTDKDYPYRHAVLLQQTRHMRSGEVTYIDHPMIGVVVKITALSGAVPETTLQPEANVPQKPDPKANPPT